MHHYHLTKQKGHFYATCQELQNNTWANAAFEITRADYWLGRLKQILLSKHYQKGL